MDYVIVHQETGLLICKECKFALIPSRINSHFSGLPHRLKPHIRNQIEIDISHIDGLVNSHQEIKSRVERFIESTYNINPLSKLAIYSDGLEYSYYSYISRSISPIKKHLKDVYN